MSALKKATEETDRIKQEIKKVCQLAKEWESNYSEIFSTVGYTLPKDWTDQFGSEDESKNENKIQQIQDKGMITPTGMTVESDDDEFTMDSSLKEEDDIIISRQPTVNNNPLTTAEMDDDESMNDGLQEDGPLAQFHNHQKECGMSPDELMEALLRMAQQEKNKKPIALGYTNTD